MSGQKIEISVQNVGLFLPIGIFMILWGCWGPKIRISSREDVITLQHTATHCNTLQHTATHCNTRQLHHAATHGNTRQHTEKHCNRLQHILLGRQNPHQLPRWRPHTATHCNTRQHAATCCNTLQLQHTATHCNTLQHTATHILLGWQKPYQLSRWCPVSAPFPQP